MSAIGGILYLDGKSVSKPILQKMSEAVKHRGPDKQNNWNKGSIGLFNNLSLTTSESKYESMPLKINDYVITADARLDNRNEIINKLGLKPPFNKLTDSELILRAYIKWEVNSPKFLLGDFAFAIWDKNKNELFCARDHFGLKPFIYYFKDNLFVFSSEIKPLFCVNQVKKSINYNRIADFIVQDLEGIDNKSTFFNSIYKLPPSYSLIIKNNKLKLNRYWNFFEDKKYENYDKNYDFEEKFLDIFTETVRRRTRNLETTGLTLSGGIDSASIAVTTKNIYSKKKIKFISATLENHEDNFEKPFVVDMERNNNITVDYINENYINDHKDIFLKFINEADDLFDVNMNLIIPLCLYARSNKLKSLVFGVDGDLVCSENISSAIYLIRNFQLLSAIRLIKEYAKFNNYSFHELLWNNALKPLIPLNAKHFYRKLLGEKASDNNLIPKYTMINSEFSKKINLENRYHSLNKNIISTPADSVPLHVKLRCNLLNMPFITAAIERYDRVCSHFSLESRHPFFDKELVEFCLGIPIEKKLENGQNKSILRNSLRTLLPESIYNKKDSFHLGPFYQNNFLDIFNNEINALADNNFYPVNEYLDSKFLNSAHRNYQKSKDFERHGNYLWRALTLDIWLKNNCN